MLDSLAKPKPKIYSQVVSRKHFPAYVRIARKLTEEGVGTYQVSEAKEQVTVRGEPLSNANLVAATFEGQQNWKPFWEVAYQAQGAIDKMYTEEKGQEEIDKAVQDILQRGIQLARRKW